MQSKIKIAAPLIFILGLFSASNGLAGRPLTVDDASVNEVGAGDFEAWYARQAGGADVWTVGPAYSVMEGVEIGVAVAQDAGNKINSSSLQVKFQFTPSLANGCNAGAAIGAARPNDGHGSTPYVKGMLSCNREEAGSLHFNLGANHPPDGPTLSTWGLAYERAFGAATAHVEYFGQEQASPSLQLGLRTELLKNVQIDGTLGRRGADSLFSMGLKYRY